MLIRVIVLTRIVSVSLGSAKRDYAVELYLLNKRLLVERIATNGSLKKAEKLLRRLDGKVDVLSLGGVNLYFKAGGRNYLYRDGQKLAGAVQYTPLVDGSGIKEAVEGRIVSYLQQQYHWSFSGQRVLLVSALDRWALGEALTAAGCKLIIGDALFGLKLPIPFYSLKTFSAVAKLTLPVLTKLPINFLYPLGEKQEKSRPRWEKIYKKADIIAGDFHFIRRYMPEKLPGAKIITSTVTNSDREFLRSRGVQTLVTAGPNIQGRAFGANVLEAICVALLDMPLKKITPQMYLPLLQKIGWQPAVEELN